MSLIFAVRVLNLINMINLQDEAIALWYGRGRAGKMKFNPF